MWQQKFRTFTQEKNQFYMNSPYTLSAEQALEQILKLKKRFEKNMHRHKELEFTQIQAKLEANVNNLWSLAQMESTGGEHRRKARCCFISFRNKGVYIFRLLP